MPLPTRHIIPISGKDSLCTALIQKTRRPDLPYEYVFLDVGMELPETYEWLGRIEKFMGVKLNRVGKSLEEIMAHEGMIPGHTARFCTRIGKLDSLVDFIGDRNCIQYVGIRADEDRPALPTLRSNIKCHYPLIEMGIDLRGVYSILQAQNLVPPDFFWQRMYDWVYERGTSYTKKFMEEMKPWTRASLFSWRSRSNCFMCFYQRLYEWVGLLEHHPDLFARAEEIEKTYGGTNYDKDPESRSYRLKAYTLRSDGPLTVVKARADEIFYIRVKKVHLAVVNARQAADDDEIDLLSLTSCGNYCGK